MVLKKIGLPIKPQTIYYVKFSANGIEQLKYTSTNTYMKDAGIFASQFKKVNDVCVVMEVLKELTKEHSSYETN
jgi:hypothetical protein